MPDEIKVKLPAGHYLVTDNAYIVDREDRYNLGNWGEDISRTWGRVYRDFAKLAGRSIREIKQLYPEFKPILICTKRPPIRFVTKKPYPFGY
jgi:hypothetical protein